MAFKFAHLSDLHLGYKATRHENSQGLNLRAVDGYVALKNIVDDIINVGVDAVIVAGDTFHMPIPDVISIIRAQSEWRKLAAAGISVYSLAGNHDTNDVRGDIAASRILHDPGRGIYSEINPYVKHTIAPGINLHMVSHHMYEEQSSTMAQVRPVEGDINIFSTHGSCIDPILKMALHANLSPREIVIPDHLLKDNDWTFSLLGHIHERGYVGSTNGVDDTSNTKIYYNGSSIRRGFADKDCELGRGWTLWTIDNGLFVPEYRTVAQRPQMDFELIDAENKSSKEISEIIIERLKETQVEGEGVWNSNTAPILRQRVQNMEPAKQSALDWAAINRNSSHAMQWQLKSINTNIEVKALGSTVDVPSLETGDVVTMYDDWVTKSSALTKARTDIHDEIRRQAREFVEAGQEVTLDE